jgi:osmotically-inducible protein OsmY
MRTLISPAIAAAAAIALFTSTAQAGPNEDLAGTVQIRLLTSDQLDGTNIFARADDGKIYLIGAVESEDAKRRAEQIARSVPGVSEVSNGIGVVPASAEQYGVHADLNTAEAAQNEAPKQGSLAPPPAGSGEPSASGTREQDRADASRCVGARYRSRLLGVPAAQTMPSLSDEELRTRVARAIESDPLLDSSEIRVARVSEGEVRLEGQAASLPAHKHALETALHVSGVCKVASDISSGGDAAASAGGEPDAADTSND